MHCEPLTVRTALGLGGPRGGSGLSLPHASYVTAREMATRPHGTEQSHRPLPTLQIRALVKG